jgi:hypothetical protein
MGQHGAMSERPTIMLVHGAWHGSWCWDALRPSLHARGFSTAVVDTPSRPILAEIVSV